MIITTSKEITSLLSIIYVLEVLGIKAAALVQDGEFELKDEAQKGICSCPYCRKKIQIGFTLRTEDDS